MFGSNQRQKLIHTGNGTLDRVLGGGFLCQTVNLFERQGPSSKILDSILNKTIATTALSKGVSLLLVNFNTATQISREEFEASLPLNRQVKSELLYKDIRAATSSAKIKIAWRYSQRGTSSPTDSSQLMSQVDFGLSLKKETLDKHSGVDSLGQIDIINVKADDELSDIVKKMVDMTEKSKSSNSDNVTIVLIKDILHPFSPVVDEQDLLMNYIYSFRCLARTLDNTVISLSYDIDMCPEHDSIKEKIYNLADSVLRFHSYETDENEMTGYKDIDGAIDYIKVPKVNSYGFFFQRELSDWGYRITKNNRYFVIDELSLPPCEETVQP